MIAFLRRFSNGRHGWVKLAALGVSVLAVLVAVRLTARPTSVPTVEVKRDEFVDALKFRGEVKALKTLQIVAPPQAGDLQILKLGQDGAFVKKGDVVVEFDRTKTVQDLAQDKSALSSAQAEIAQTRAQGRLVEEESLTAVKKARYDVEVAKLDATKKEIISRIEGEEAKLTLADAEQKFLETAKKWNRTGPPMPPRLEANNKPAKKIAMTHRPPKKLSLLWHYARRETECSPWMRSGIQAAT